MCGRKSMSILKMHLRREASVQRWLTGRVLHCLKSWTWRLSNASQEHRSATYPGHAALECAGVPHAGRLHPPEYGLVRCRAVEVNGKGAPGHGRSHSGGRKPAVFCSFNC
jgi:hypothetical protein